MANLNEAIAASNLITHGTRIAIGILHAGGPGSGRKAEGGRKPPDAKIHKLLSDKGFKFSHGDSRNSVWSNYSKGQHNIAVKSNGDWVHRQNGETKGNGNNAKYLSNYLNRYTNISAGAFGKPDRHPGFRDEKGKANIVGLVDYHDRMAKYHDRMSNKATKSQDKQLAHQNASRNHQNASQALKKVTVGEAEQGVPTKVQAISTKATEHSMKLAQKTMSAGGPGSGRRPGLGYSEKDAYKMASRHSRMAFFHETQDAKLSSKERTFSKHGETAETHGDAEEHFKEAAEHYAKGNTDKGDKSMNKGYERGEIAFEQTRDMGFDNHPAMKELASKYK